MTLITGFTCSATIYFKFITKCDKCYYKVRQLFLLQSAMVCYYKVRQVLQSVTILLQSATGITKCDDYYKVRQYKRFPFSGRRNKRIFRAYPSICKIAELCFETTAGHSTIFPKPSALSPFSLFEEQAQALLSHCHFHSFLILHYIYYISLHFTFHITLHFTGKQR